MRGGLFGAGIHGMVPDQEPPKPGQRQQLHGDGCGQVAGEAAVQGAVHRVLGGVCGSAYGARFKVIAPRIWPRL